MSRLGAARSGPSGGRGAVVVTGASTGIGAAVAHALAGHGFRVHAGVRTPEAGERLVDAAPGGGVIEPVLLDVTAPEHLRRLSELIEQRHGRHGLAGLVNNAGIAVGGPLEHLPVQDLRRQLEVNVVAQVAVTQALLPALRRARGRIVITGSDSGYFASPLLGAYSMSKFAMEAFADSLRRELRPSGVRVCLLQPGAIRTEIWDKGLDEARRRFEAGPEDQRRHYGPLVERVAATAEREAARASPPEAVARAVVHALTARRPRTRYVRGSGARQLRLLSALPDRVADLIVARYLRW